MPNLVPALPLAVHVGLGIRGMVLTSFGIVHMPQMCLLELCRAAVQSSVWTCEFGPLDPLVS
eukprot:2499630-Amphidinium_carterae.1